MRAQSQELPSAERFSPVINESFLINDPSLLKVNLNRRRLFSGKTFVFMSQRQMSKFRDLVTEAGGKSISLDSARFDKKDLLKKENILVQYVSTSQSQASEDVARLVQFVAKHGRRAIAEDEIGLAIFHGSILQFCNPDRSFKSNFEVSTIDLTDDNALIMETPGNEGRRSESNLFIKETVDLIDEDSLRPIESGTTDSQAFENSGFDFADAEPLEVDANVIPSDDSSKRKAEELEAASNVPEKRRKIEDDKPSSERLTSQVYSQNIGFIRTDNHNRSQSIAADSPDQPSTSNASVSRDKRNMKRRIIDENSDDFEFDFGPVTKLKRKTSSVQRGSSSTRKSKDLDSDDEEFHFTLPQKVTRSSKPPQSEFETKDSNGNAGNLSPPAKQIVEVKKDGLEFVDVTRSTAEGFLSTSRIEEKTNDSIGSLSKSFANLYDDCNVVEKEKFIIEKRGNASVIGNNFKTFRKVIELIIINDNRCIILHRTIVPFQSYITPAGSDFRHVVLKPVLLLEVPYGRM